MQEGILFHCLMGEDAYSYFEQSSFRIRGQFNIELCHDAWNQLFIRHEILRSVFLYENISQPIQVILKERQIEFYNQDIRTLDFEQRELFLEQYKKNDIHRGFDLSTDVLIRVAVFQIDDTAFEMILSHPHILLDGWSGGILQKELLQIYGGLLSNREIHLPKPSSYHTYIDWLKSRDYPAAEEFWKNLLADYTSVVTLPSAICPCHPNEYHLAEHTFTLDIKCSNSLQSLAARYHVTLNTLLQAIWAIQLGWYNSTDDVVFGVVVSGRSADIVGIEEMPGLFINTIPMRYKLCSGQPFIQWVQQAQTNAIQYQQFDFLPLTKIQSLSPIKQNLLNHLFVYENYPQDSMIQDNLHFSSLNFDVESIKVHDQAHYDFGILIQPGKELTIKFLFNSKRFDQDYIQRIRDHFQTIIHRVLQNEMILLAEIDGLCDREQHQILVSFNQCQFPYPDDKTLADIWKESVIQFSNKTALEFKDHTFTYSDIDHHATQVADFLHNQIHLSLEECVAVLLDRSEWQIFALLGILKAQGAYLPIDPSYPLERIQYILEDSKCRVLLTHESILSRCKFSFPYAILDITKISADQPSSHPIKGSSRQLAYVIYTSGSTGRPKGVLLEHRGFMNMIFEQIRGFGIRADDRVLQFASCSFDASLSEIFMTFFSGATLCLVEEETIRQGLTLRDFMIQKRISVVTFPPSYLRALDHAIFPDLRVLITAGEAVIKQDAIYYAQQLHFFNAYGPTETSVCATFHPVQPNETYLNGIPIGRPLSNTKIRIVNHRLQLMPIGIPGEICVSGPGLARGYFNLPEQTENCFVPSPFENNERMYRTGDRGFWLPDGTIVYCGRADDQVKIRGYRIELSEIELCLLRYPGLRQCAVHIHNDMNTNSIAAYYVADTIIDIHVLREHCKRILPAYMVPAYFIQMETFPLTPNLKVDKKALPPPNLIENSLKTYVPPRNDKEKQLADLWKEILHVDRVGIYDSFHDLGGDSIQAIHLIGRAQKIGVYLRLQDLFESRTLSDLVNGPPPFPLSSSPSPLSGPIPLTPVQRWFFEEHPTDSHHCNHLIFLRTQEPIQEKVIFDALSFLQERHDIFRIQFQETQNGIQPILCLSNISVNFQCVDLRSKPDDIQTCLQHARAQQNCFHFSQASLWKITLYRLRHETRILLAVHHLLIDAVSWNILIEELTTLYSQFLHRKPIHLPPSTTPYTQWSKALVEYSQNRALLDEQAYWETINATPHECMRRDYDNVQSRYGQTKVITFSFSPQETQSLLANHCHSNSQELYELLLTCYGRAYHRWNQSHKTRIHLTHHGRPDVLPGTNVSRTIGWFTLYFPFLLECEPNNPYHKDRELIRKSLQSIPQNGFGYGIIKYLSSAWVNHPKSQCSHPEICFNFLGNYDHPFSNSLFTIADDFPFSSISDQMERPWLLEVDGIIEHQKLTLTIRYDVTIHQGKSIGDLSSLFQKELKSLILS